jgi:hypothetical protein
MWETQTLIWESRLAKAVKKRPQDRQRRYLIYSFLVAALV